MRIPIPLFSGWDRNTLFWNGTSFLNPEGAVSPAFSAVCLLSAWLLFLHFSTWVTPSCLSRHGSYHSYISSLPAPNIRINALNLCPSNMLFPPWFHTLLGLTKGSHSGRIQSTPSAADSTPPLQSFLKETEQEPWGSSISFSCRTLPPDSAITPPSRLGGAQEHSSVWGTLGSQGCWPHSWEWKRKKGGRKDPVERGSQSDQAFLFCLSKASTKLLQCHRCLSLPCLRYPVRESGTSCSDVLSQK